MGKYSRVIHTHLCVVYSDSVTLFAFSNRYINQRTVCSLHLNSQSYEEEILLCLVLCYTFWGYCGDAKTDVNVDRCV